MLGWRASPKGNRAGVHQIKKNQSINNFRGVKAVESKPFVPDSQHALPNGLMLPFCPCTLSEFSRVLWLLAAYSVLLPSDELSFKYHRGSLVCLPLRCEAECKLLKIGIGYVGLGYKTSLRSPNASYEPVLVHMGWSLCNSCRQWSSGGFLLLANWIPPFGWELSVGTPSWDTYLFTPLQREKKKYTFSLVGGSAARLGMSQEHLAYGQPYASVL